MAQTWDPKAYEQNGAFVHGLAGGVVEWLAAQPGERILDLGCGDGVLSAVIAERGAEVVGVDASPEMVAAARARGIDARVMDGRRLEAGGGYDAVFSNAALHWMKPPEKVVEGVSRALRPGGRFVGEFGGYGNVATIVAALEAALSTRNVDPGPFNPWYFPTDEEYRALLASHGFVVRDSMLFPRPTPLPGHVIGWLETFAQPFAAALWKTQRPAFFQSVMEACRPVLCDSDGHWNADYVRLRFFATKPAD